VAVTVRDGGNQTASRNLMFTILPPDPLSITTGADLGTTPAKQLFSRTLQASGGKPAYTWTLSSRGNLPAGANLTSAGVLTANSSTHLAANFTVRVADALGANATRAMWLYFLDPAISSFATVQGGVLPQGASFAGHQVSAFQIGQHEVTWAEWQAVRSWAVANGYSDLANTGNGSAGNHPVRDVSWHDAAKWCNARSEREGLSPVYTVNGTVYRTGTAVPQSNPLANGYRMPTGAEWEWAARGGTLGQNRTYSGGNQVVDVAWFYGNSFAAPVPLWEQRGTMPVGQKAANELGIRDMSGNVWEWCWDSQGNARLIRGGGFTNADYECAVAHPGYFATALERGVRRDLGLRLARNIGPKISVTGNIPPAAVGEPYPGFTFGVAGGNGTNAWSIVEGALPAGMSLNATTGRLSGTPTSAGSFTFAVRVASGGFWDELDVDLPVSGLFVAVRGGTLPQGSGLANQTVESFEIGKYEVTWAEWKRVRDWAVSNGYDLAAQHLSLGGWASADNHFALYKGEQNGNNLQFLGTVSDFDWGTPQPIQGFRLEGGEFLFAAVVEEQSSTTSGFIANFGQGASTSDAGKWMVATVPFAAAKPGWRDLPTVEEVRAGIASAAWQSPSVWNGGRTINGTTGIAMQGQPGSSFALARFNPSIPVIGTGSGENHPVREVEWANAVKWCNARSEMEGLQPVYLSGNSTYRTGQGIPAINPAANGYRLPTEAEWEWAARGGALGQGYTYSGGNNVDAVAWHEGNSGDSTWPVGSKAANELGIHDMSGNVWEWFLDRDGSTPRIRGGSYVRPAGFCEVSYRSRPADGLVSVGFRLARSLPAQPLAWGTQALPAGRVASGYSANITATGGRPRYIFSLKAGSALPPGIELDSRGGLAGTPAAAGSHIFTVTARDSAAPPASIERTFLIDVAPSAAPALSETAGIARFEAENFTSSSAGTMNGTAASGWVRSTDPAGFTGPGSMRAWPADSASANSTANSAVLAYTVQFTNPGTYYIWLRGFAEDTDRASAFVSVNSATPAMVTLSGNGAWEWTNSNKQAPASAPAAFHIPSAGNHTVRVWMAGAGFRIDRILATSGPNFSPEFSPDFWRNQNIYQIITDRFFDGDPSNNVAGLPNFNASAGDRAHGGDFKGIEQKLDYIQALGATAVWISPVLRNANGDYHGYAATDFYRTNPRMGSLAELQRLVAEARRRGILVVNDVVVNHGSTWVDSGDLGWSAFRRPPAGYNLKYNSGGQQYAAPFDNASLTARFGNANLANIFNNNGGTQNWSDPREVELGELLSLDDFRTESPYIREKMREIWAYWLEAAGFDAYRIDTVKHVEMGFWDNWCPAIREAAVKADRPNFFQFGEVFHGSDSLVGSYTGNKTTGTYKMESVLDYPLYYQIGSVFATATGNTGQIENRYTNLTAANYDASALDSLVLNIDNHDNPRFLAATGSTPARLELALAFLYTSRGIPSLYYGTEQDFNGGSDPANREDMFDGLYEQGPSLGDNFNMASPRFKLVARLNNLRRLYPSLRTGTHTNLWANFSGPGLLAYARRLGNEEAFVVINTSTSAQTIGARATIHPAGTVLVNAMNPLETVTVASGTDGIPAMSIPGTSFKIFIAQSQWKNLNPVVETVSPAHDAAAVSPSTAITVAFGRPMSTSATQAAFSTTPAASGTFAWGANSTALTFTPSANLAGNTTYTVRIAATAADTLGTPFHAPFESSFRTGAATGLARPAVNSTSASGITTGGATLNATVTPNGAATTVHFEYGTTASYGSSTPGQAVGNGTSPVAVSAPLAGLAANTQYHYRAVAVNSQGTTQGPGATFATSAPLPLANTGSATAVGSSSANLTGTVNPNGLPAFAWFEYGVLAESLSSATTGVSIGNGTATANFSAPVAGLAPSTTYFFRIVAQTGSTEVRGSVQSFTTNAAFTPVSISGSSTASGQQYSALAPLQFSATGGVAPYSWSTVPALPSVLTINATSGLVSGNLTAAPGNYTVAVTVRDGANQTATRNLTVTVTPLPSLAWGTLAALPAGREATAYSANLTATGGLAPYTFSTKNGSSLPAGLTLNATTGRLSGTPSTPGNHSFTLTATDSASPANTIERLFTLSVEPYGMSVGGNTTASGQQFSVIGPVQFSVTGGVAPYSWSTNPALPASLSINATSGLVSGNLTAAPGNYTVAVTVRDGANQTATRNLTVTVTPLPSLAWGTLAALPAGREATAYSANLTATGGLAPYIFFTKNGSSLPAGLTLNATTGRLSGTPSTPGNHSFTLTATDSASPANTIERLFTLSVEPYGMSVGGNTTASGQQYSTLAPVQFSVTGGVAPYSWSTNPALPASLSMNATSGLVSGNLTAAPGNYTVAVTVRDGANQTATRNLTVTVTPLPSLAWGTLAALPAGREATAYSANLTATGGLAPYTFSTKNGSSLPAGLTLNATTGRLSGTPSTPGNHSFTLTATDSASPANTADRLFTLSVEPYGMSVGGNTTASGQQFSVIGPVQFSVTGGVAPYSWSTSPALPASLSMNATSGLVSGNLTAAPGNYTVVVTVRDGANQTATRNLTVTVATLPTLVWNMASVPRNSIQTIYRGAFGNYTTASGKIWSTGSGTEFPNTSAFAAFTSNGSVVAWPSWSTYGGNSEPVAGSLSSNVTALYSNMLAFAALKRDGSVVTWGDETAGGNSSLATWNQSNSTYSYTSVADSLSSNITAVYSNRLAFAAVKSDGSVVSWGNAGGGGNSSAVAGSLSSNVTAVYSSLEAFAALKTDGSVVTWGGSGGNSSAVAGSLSSNVTAVYSSQNAFAALKGNGSVVIWGPYASFGGVEPAAGSLSSNVTSVYSNQSAFAAVKANGSVVTWGWRESGGNSSIATWNQGNSTYSYTSVAGSLSSNVTAIYSSQNAFAAVKSDGSVVAWGGASYGGNSSAVAGSLSSNVTAVYSTVSAFAALKRDGSLVTWGNASGGGDSSSVAGSLSSNVTAVYSTESAFAALKSDGSVVTWGDPWSGGNSSSVAGSLSSNVTAIYSTARAFAALKRDGSVVGWGSFGNTPPNIAPPVYSTLSNGRLATGYSANLSVSGGLAPYTFSTKNGSSLPAGLTLNATTGRLSGTPTAAGNYSFTLSATDSASPANIIERLFTLTVEPYGMSVGGNTTASGQQYSALAPVQFSVTGGLAPYSWSTNPALPASLSINATSGLVSGNLTAAPGNYTVAVTVRDGANQTATRNLTVTVTPLPSLAWGTLAALPAGREATAYSANLTATGGLAPYTFSTKNGSSLPAGLTLNATTGRLSGTPSTPGNYSFTLTATDSASPANTIERLFTLSVEPYGMSVGGNTTASGQQFSVIAPVQFSVTGGVAPYSWSTVPALPAGLSVNATSGLVSGNLTAAPGNYTVAVTVRDGANQTATRNLAISVAPVRSTIASDNASNYAGGNWTNGSNGGTGFGPWTIFQWGYAGVFIGNPSIEGITGMPQASFGMWSRPDAEITARRDILGGLQPGRTLKFQWGVNWDSSHPSGKKGFTLALGNFTTVDVAISNNSSILVNGVDTGFGYGTVGMDWSFERTASGGVLVSATDRDGTGTFTRLFFDNTVQEGWSMLTLYSQSMGDDATRRNQFFNNFEVSDSQPRVGVQGGVLATSNALNGMAVSAFEIGKYEVLWGEWKQVRSLAPARGYTDLAAGNGTADNHPVRDVTWHDVVKWCNARSELEGLQPVYRSGNSTYRTGQLIPTVDASANGHRLPTEAEWEWAARGGTLSRNLTYSGSSSLGLVGWYDFNSFGQNISGGRGTWPGGFKVPNELGIFDMSGNVWEWCWNAWDAQSTARRIRGGSWNVVDWKCAVADRVGLCEPNFGAFDIGFRTVRNIGPRISISGTMPSATAGQAYAGFAFGASGGNSPNTWSVTQGVLPLGMSLNALTGSLTGTPLAAGNYTFVVRVSSGPYWDEVEVRLAVAPNPSSIVLLQGGTLPAGSGLANQTASGFRIAKFETTWGEWKGVRAWAVANGYSDLANTGNGSADNHPVRDINWYDAVKWCNAKSELEGLAPAYTLNGTTLRAGQPDPTSLVVRNAAATGYRLPREAEWEWAARGGANSQNYTYSGGNDLNSVGWTFSNSQGAAVDLGWSGRGTWPVGQKSANELGLHDMSGNLWEWCEDIVATNNHPLRGAAWDTSNQTLTPVSYRGYQNGAGNRAAGGTLRYARNAIGDMAAVQGGTLPAGSGLANQTVQAFQIARTEVTFGEWKAVRSWASSNGYDISAVGTATSDDRPVVQMNWHDALKWCNAKSQMEGLVPVYTVNGTTYRTGQSVPAANTAANGYRLPSEAEWEWAARGGASSQGFTYSGGNTLGTVAWFGDNVPTAASRPAGTKAPNELGIFDMSGNVWEWCYDNSGASRVTRGGSWFRGASTGGVDQCAVANRGFNNLDITSRTMADVGFRTARNAAN
jgi:formylglycine-generating enzyme required for sulfatase activity/glycosidase